MKSIAYVLIALLGIAVVAPTAGAQSTTAQISGTIKDQSGAVLPGVEVTVTQTATGAKRTAVSNETGNYVLASLPLGTLHAGGRASGVQELRAKRDCPASRRESNDQHRARSRTGDRSGRSSVQRRARRNAQQR